jgi:predicted ATPase
MIKSLVVRGLHGKFDFDLDFNEDINIITGKNGSGKTSILKVIWYILSGHTELLSYELNFSYAKLFYDSHIVEVFRAGNNIEVKFDGELSHRFMSIQSTYDSEFFQEGPLISRGTTASIFFPTFRRIEGGYGIKHSDKADSQRVPLAKTNLEKALSEIPEQLNTINHQFITTISTRDIRIVLNKEYYTRLEKSDKIQKTANQEITEQLKSIDNVGTKGDNSIIHELKQKMENIERQREELLKPFNALSNIVSDFFKNKGIEISGNISFGERTEMLSSDKLSAGEKQMLSFLCYNAFTNNSTIFIDEPELSLHVDWQRQLLPTLMKQGTKNQFFIATHSPFIYGMYPDKEIELISSSETVKA